MKSVIAQGSSVVKAIEEALKKAGMPAEFFVKLLEEAQSGFLGFGAKKAKIALFFKQHNYPDKKDGILNQNVYEDLFDNSAINKQIEQELKGIELPKTGTQTTQHKPNPQKQYQNNPHTNRPMRQRELPNTAQNNAPRPIKQENKPQINQKDGQKTSTNQQQHANLQPRKRPLHQRPINNQPKENNSPNKPLIRPLPPKNNDSSKS